MSTNCTTDCWAKLNFMKNIMHWSFQKFGNGKFSLTWLFINNFNMTQAILIDFKLSPFMNNTSIIFDNNVGRFMLNNAIKINRHTSIWADFNFVTKAFLHLWNISFHINTIIAYPNQKIALGIEAYHIAFLLIRISCSILHWLIKS